MKNQSIVILLSAFLLFTLGCGNGFTANLSPDGIDLSAERDMPSTPAPDPLPNPTPAPPTPPPPAVIPALPYTGKITSFPLPANTLAPYRSNGGSKHTNMAFSPATNRLYVSGGDWLHSATDGTWSMNLTDGSWRQDVGDPVYPSLPAPHALQDGAGFEWVAGRGKFLIWPGSYFPYDAKGAPIRNYSKGMWWFDPITNKYTQDLTFFGNEFEGSGCLFGGAYDEINNQIVNLHDASAGFGVVRRDLMTGLKLPTIGFSLAKLAGYPAAYFMRSKPVKVGRHIYMIGFRTDGASAKAPLMIRWHLDNHTMEELAPPPVDATGMSDIETRPGVSHGKIVWPYTKGPDGEIYGIYVFDPSSNKWFVDKQIPNYGNFIGNAVTSLPDGRVAFSGGAFGRQQTHIWFYEAN